MKKVIAVLVIVLVVFLAVNRQRVYLWDPIATVSRDGAKVDGVRVLINYSNDVLLQDGSAGRRRLYLVQNWNKVAATPTAELKCLRPVACLADADQASAAALTAGSRSGRAPFEGVTMTNKQVEFVDEDGALVDVRLR